MYTPKHNYLNYGLWTLIWKQTADDSFDFEDAGCEVDLTELEEACVSLRWSQTADDSFD